MHLFLTEECLEEAFRCEVVDADQPKPEFTFSGLQVSWLCQMLQHREPRKKRFCPVVLLYRSHIAAPLPGNHQTKPGSSGAEEQRRLRQRSEVRLCADRPVILHILHATVG